MSLNDDIVRCIPVAEFLANEWIRQGKRCTGGIVYAIQSIVISYELTGKTAFDFLGRHSDDSPIDMLVMGLYLAFKAEDEDKKEIFFRTFLTNLQRSCMILGIPLHTLKDHVPVGDWLQSQIELLLKSDQLLDVS